MRHLIIPDVHNKTAIADQILEYGLSVGKCDRVIFTGDFFDSFHDDDSHALSTAKWLKEKLQDSRFQFIAGNHDTSYRWSHHYHFVQCSGFAREKQKAISSVLTKDDWDKFLPYVRVGKFFFSHAGISRELIALLHDRGLIEEDAASSADKLQASLDQVFEKAYKTIGALRCPEVYDVSYMRGGRAEIGGVTWCDISEFNPINGIYQVFGHTPVRNSCVVRADNRWFYPTLTVHDDKGLLIHQETIHSAMRSGCGIGIDTHLNGFAILDDSALEVYSCKFDKPHSDIDFTRRVTEFNKVWSHTHTL